MITKSRSRRRSCRACSSTDATFALSALVPTRNVCGNHLPLYILAALKLASAIIADVTHRNYPGSSTRYEVLVCAASLGLLALSKAQSWIRFYCATTPCFPVPPSIHVKRPSTYPRALLGLCLCLLFHMHTRAMPRGDARSGDRGDRLGGARPGVAAGTGRSDRACT